MRFVDLFFLASSTIMIVFYGLMLKYSLEGRSIYIALKDHMESTMEDKGFKEYINRNALKLATGDT